MIDCRHWRLVSYLVASLELIMNDHSQVSLDYTANLLPTIIPSDTQCLSLRRFTIIFPFPQKAKLDIKCSNIGVFFARPLTIYQFFVSTG